MTFKNPLYPLIKLPSNTELLLFLIKEDLKNHKFFEALRGIGLDDCYYTSDLGTLILAYAGFDRNSDEAGDFYYKLLARYAENMEPDRESIMTAAFELYTELTRERKKKEEPCK